MNLIRVGIESFTASDEQEIDLAVQFTRDNWAQVSLGVVACCASSSRPPKPTATPTSAATERLPI